MKKLLIRALLIAMIISGLCLADEFHSISAKKATVQIIQNVHNQQTTPQQLIPSCQSYKHRNTIYFGPDLHIFVLDAVTK